MTEEQLINNKLILEFLGRQGKVNKSLYTFKELFDLVEDIWISVEDTKFHSDWNWLMLSYNKARLYLNTISIIKNEEGFIIIDLLQRAIKVVDMKKTYYYLIEFIEWYNLKKKNI